MLKRQRVCQLALAANILMCLGCDGPTHPIAQTEIRLSASTITRVAPSGAQVHYTVANLGATAVQITTRCGDQLMPAIEQRTGNGWQQYSGGACITINLMSPVSLEAGAQREGVVEIVDVGQYRLVLGTDKGSLTSPAFTVK